MKTDRSQFHLLPTASLVGTVNDSSGAERAIARAWLLANIAILGGVITTSWTYVPAGVFGAWSSFVLLNVWLHAWIHATAPSAERNRREKALAAVLGSSWGAGLAALLPAVPAGLDGMVLFSAAAIALAALPVLNAQRSAYIYFVTPLIALMALALIRDGHFVPATPWLVLGGTTLLMTAAAYWRSQEELRGVLRRVLALTVANRPAIDPADSDQHLVQRASRALDRLRIEQARHLRDQRLLHALGDALLGTDQQGRVDYVNPVAETILGRTVSELLGQPIEACLRIIKAPDGQSVVRELFDQVRSSLRPQFSSDEAQLLRADGVLYGVDYSVTPLTDEAGTFVGASFVVRDVTLRRQRHDRIAWQATHDALTGTINRSEFERRLNQLLAIDPGAREHPYTLLFIDLDKFKFINDSYGHAAGDYVLRTLAEVLRKRVRGADTLARLGGDEFCALLHGCNADKARLLAEGLRIAVERHEFNWHGVELPVSLSVGVVAIGADARSSTDLLHAADSACYVAKQYGRNRVELVEHNGDADDSQQAQSLQLVKEIQSALHGQRLDLFYQPLCATLAAHPSTRCEITVGIRDSTERLLPHQEVIDLAARFRLSAEVDRWVIKATIDALRLQHPAFDGMQAVFVPLSVQALTDQRVLEFAIGMVREHRDQADRLGFTIPAAALALHPEFVRYFIATLKQDGCQFMVSDLGFGGNVIDLIKSMQIDYLGIGTNHVANMLASSVDYEVVLGLSRVARALGMHAVAEHADSLMLREALAQMGVEFTKGHFRDGPRRLRPYGDLTWM